MQRKKRKKKVEGPYGKWVISKENQEMRLHALNKTRNATSAIWRGKKGQGVEPTSSINYRNRALDELVGERERDGSWERERKGVGCCV